MLAYMIGIFFILKYVIMFDHKLPSYMLENTKRKLTV